MASGSKNLYCANYPNKYPYILSVSCSEASYDAANNTSTISVSGSIDGPSSAWSSRHASYLYIYWVDENEHTSKKYITETSFLSCGLNNGGKRSVSGSITVKHKDDGTLRGYAVCTFDDNGENCNGYKPGSATVESSWLNLTNIPRTPNAPTNAVISGEYEKNSSVTITFTKSSSSFATGHKIYYRTWTKDNGYSAWEVVDTTTNTSYSNSFSNIESDGIQMGVTAINGSLESGRAETGLIYHQGIKVNSNGFKNGKIKVWNGSQWVQGYVKVWNGSQWVRAQ